MTINKRSDNNVMNNDKGIFINLSNHPSTVWSNEQLEAARTMGDIVDVPFPAVSSSMDSDGVLLLATEYADKLLAVADGRPLAVHVMGEMCFTVCFVNIMTHSGVKCFASTTERIVTDKGNGVKETVFRFVRFRQYLCTK